MKTVRLIRPWRRFDVGRKLQRTDAAAEVLVSRGIAEYVSLAKTRKPIATQPAAPKAEAATATPKAKTKRKPAKKAAPKRKAAPKKRAAKKPAPKRPAKKAKR